MAILTVEALAEYMKLEIVAESALYAAAESVIDGLEADLEAYLRRPLVPTVFTDEVVRVDTLGRVFFKNTPVVEITSFSVDGTPVASGSWMRQTYGVSGLSFVHLSSPLRVDPLLTATYTGGLPGDDATDVFTRKALATLKRAAARDLNSIRQDAVGVSALNVEGTSITFAGAGRLGADAGLGGLLDVEKAGFSRWRRRIVRGYAR